MCSAWAISGTETLVEVAEGNIAAIRVANDPDRHVRTLNIVVWVKSNAGQGSFYRSAHELIAVFVSALLRI
jgi:hypothetical protein